MGAPLMHCWLHCRMRSWLRSLHPLCGSGAYLCDWLGSLSWTPGRSAGGAAEIRLPRLIGPSGGLLLLNIFSAPLPLSRVPGLTCRRLDFSRSFFVRCGQAAGGPFHLTPVLHTNTVARTISWGEEFSRQLVMLLQQSAGCSTVSRNVWAPHENSVMNSDACERVRACVFTESSALTGIHEN